MKNEKIKGKNNIENFLHENVITERRNYYICYKFNGHVCGTIETIIRLNKKNCFYYFSCFIKFLCTIMY